jgi:hypothetical protein
VLDNKIGSLASLTTSNKTSVVNAINENASSLADMATNYVAASKYGFKADYVGTPQYDGQDGTRITCTDNTTAFAAMLDDCIAKKNLTVYFPRGQYGIKTGNIVKNLTGCTLTIIGDGVESSIIDFVKEDASKTVYVDENNANFIAKITNANQIIIKDIHIKATTNRNNVNGNQGDTNAVYYGSVWGLILDTFNYLKCERVKVSRFNYRGISTFKTGATSNATCNPLVEIIDCVGTENKGSGFWLKYIKEVRVKGGEFSYNGQLGTIGTGYGVTCQMYVGRVIVQGGYYHHNYRKGFDTHGCLNVTMKDVIFEDNVLYNFAILGWAVYTTTNRVDINNVNMLRIDKTWLKSCYQACVNNGFTSQVRGILFAINEQTQAGSYQNILQKVYINNLNIKGGYCGDEETQNQSGIGITILAPVADIRIENSDWDLTDWKVNSNSVYSSMPIQIDPSTLYFNKSSIKWLEDSNWTTDKGSLFVGLGMANRTYQLKDTKFELNNCYLFAQTGVGGTIQPPGDSSNTTRIFENLTVTWITLPALTTDRKLFGEQADLYPKTVDNVKARINGIQYTPSLSQYFKDDKAQRVTVGTAITTTGTSVIDIILDGSVTSYTLEVDGFNDYLRVVTDTVKTNGSLITFKSRTTFTDTDGRTKTRITLSNNATINAVTYYVRARISGNQNSWGIEKINYLGS